MKTEKIAHGMLSFMGFFPLNVYFKETTQEVSNELFIESLIDLALTEISTLTEYKVAYIKYFKECGEDDSSKCKKLKWEETSKMWAVIDIELILRVVHVVEYFDEVGSGGTEYYLLNRYLWRDAAATCEEECD